MSVPAQALRSDGVRSFTGSMGFENNRSQANERSTHHNSVENFVISEEDTENGTHALASVLMPPPILPRVDIVLHKPEPSEDDEDDETSPTVDLYEHRIKKRTQENSTITSDTDPLSQGTRTALLELSTNTAIMLWTNVTGPSQDTPLLHSRIRQDENGDQQCPGAVSDALKQRINNINARRILRSGTNSEDEVVVPGHNRFEEHEDITGSADNHEVANTVTRVDVEASAMLDFHVSTGSGEALHTELMAAVPEGLLERRADSLAHTDDETDHQPRPSASSTESRSLAEAGQAPEAEQTFESLEVCMEESKSVQAAEQMENLETGTHPSSGSSRKRKAASYTRKDSVPNKRSRAVRQSSLSDQENEEEDTITVEYVEKSAQIVPANDEMPSPNPRRTTRTPKPRLQSILPASSTISTKSRSVKGPRDLATESTPSRSRSTSIASATQFAEYRGLPPKVLFTSTTTADRKGNTMKDFAKLGGKEVEKIDHANMLIVGGTTLKKTANLIIAVARGMDVVHECWIIESRRKNVLLDIIPFLPKDEAHEAEWGTKLVDATARGKEGVVQTLLHNTTIHTTKDLDKGVIARDLPSIVKALGGSIVKGSLPSASSRTKNMLILGTPQDPQAVEVHRMGYKLFDKDLIILGALRGKIDTESPEFEVGVPVKEEKSE